MPENPPNEAVANTEGGRVADFSGNPHELMGQRLRQVRLEAGVGVRELARRVNVSASLISQIELGRVVPSVSTLYTITNALDISMDSLFVASDDAKETNTTTPMTLAAALRVGSAALIDSSGSDSPYVLRKANRRAIELERGVRWELLTPRPEHGAEFLVVVYPVGGGSIEATEAIRHNGRDYCLILEGALSVQIGFENLVLTPGDSLAFDATIPHRFWNEGDGEVRAVWFVLDRSGSHASANGGPTSH